jgi:hypothetical protein
MESTASSANHTTFTGIVRDSATRKPLENAQLILHVEPAYGAITDKRGRYSIVVKRIPDGEQVKLSAKRIEHGVSTQVVPVNAGIVRVNFVLPAIPVFRPITVTH